MVTGKNAFQQFKSHATRFEWANAYLCLCLTRLSQPESVGLHTIHHPEFEKRLAAVLQNWGLNRYQILTFAHEETPILVTANDEVVIAAFQGGDTFAVPGLWRDKEADLCTHDQYGPGRVHSRRVQSVEKVLPALAAAIATFRTNSQAVWLTGHSVGGALAVLAAYRLIKNNISVQGVYTYGQPKVGDWMFMISFYDALPPSRYYRFVNHIDVIPDLPAAERPLPAPPAYAHFGQLIYIKGNGVIVRNPRLDIVKADRQNGHLCSEAAPSVLQEDAHDSLLYVARIYKKLPKVIQSAMPVPAIVPLISC